MLETLLEHRFYVTSVILFVIGFITLFLHRNLIKKIIGMNLMDTAVFLFLASMGYVEGGTAPIIAQGEELVYINPVPGGLVLTGIVVAVSTTAFSLSLTQRLYKRYGTVNLDEILLHVRSEHREQE